MHRSSVVPERLKIIYYFNISYTTALFSLCDVRPSSRLDQYAFYLHFIQRGLKMKWEYFSAYCSVKREGVFGFKSYRVLNIDDQEYKLVQGLNFLGQQGWELIAVHQLDESHGGQIGGIRDLTFLYIFKKPLSL